VPDRRNSADEVVKPPSDENNVEKLRELLGVADAEGVREIFRRLDDPEIRARDLSGVLPDAVMLSARGDDRLGDALEPSVQRAVHAAIHHDPGSFADALYPAMAPTIRRAITENLRTMVQSLNEILKHVFSIQGVRWRWQAIRTRRPFAEVVLSHSLVYRVEQAFLIHRETGLLLQHVVDPAAEAQDPDLVSSMLTAIQDFVHDSFTMGEDEGLEGFRVGDLTVWLERGRDAALAVAIRGNAPESIREDLRENLRTIHLGFAEELTAFSGDSGVFDAARTDVERCLVSNYRQPSSRPSPMLWILVTALVLVLGFWMVTLYRERQRVTTFVENLEVSPGIAVTTWERSGGKIVVRGLRDPLAADPFDIARESGMAEADLDLGLEAFTSLEEELVMERARRLLEPPPGVDFELVEGELTAHGTAPPAWIALADVRAPMIPGVDGFHHRGRQSEPNAELVELADRSERRLMRFPSLSAEFLETDMAVLDALAEDLRTLIDDGLADGWRVNITLVGHADSTGDETLNLELSDQRALALEDELIARGIDSQLLSVVGMGSSKPLDGDADPQTRGDDRRVTVGIEFIADAWDTER
jgi:outer membrane protein OmpA-like peptidoglycan-associated protein